MLFYVEKCDKKSTGKVGVMICNNVMMMLEKVIVNNCVKQINKISVIEFPIMSKVMLIGFGIIWLAFKLLCFT